MSTESVRGEEGDAELSSWAEDFKGGADESPPLSPEAVLEEAARATRKERLAWISQLAGLVFAAAVFLGLVVRTRSVLQAVLTSVVLPTLLALFGYTIHVRQGVARQRGGKNADTSVQSFVSLMVERRRADLSIVRVNRYALAFLATVFWIWFPIFVLSRADRFGAEPWRLLVGAGSSLVIFGATWWHLGRVVRKAHDELDRWSKIAAWFEERRADERR